MKKEYWLGIGIILLTAANGYLYFTNKEIIESQTPPVEKQELPAK